MRSRAFVLALCLAAAAALSFGLAAPCGAQESGVDPHAAHTGFRFKDPAMDFVFASLVLGSAVNHGCEIGEAFATAASISDGDADSWSAEWLKTAALIEARGDKALAGGHAVSARDQFLRAAYAYRIAMVSMLPGEARLVSTAAKSRELMRRAGKLLSPELEYVEIAYDGVMLPGYFRKAAPGDRPAPTLVMIGGAETFAEDQYFYIAPQAFDRGYNFLTVDLPGQGLLPLQGRFFTPEIGAAISAVADYALSRNDVDPKRLAVYGISSGGGFVPMAAQRDHRFAAIVMNNCVVDAGAGVAKMAVAKATPETVKGWSSFVRVSNQLIAWRFGVDMNNLPGLVDANRDLRFDPAKVAAPALILVAAGEYKSAEIERQNRLCLDCLASARKAMVVAPAAEGASNHCVMENRSLMSQVVFDWLDDAFKAR